MSSALGWLIGGGLGGVLGAAAFGVLMWLLDPEIVEAAIPSLYGLEPAGVTGWAIHLAHGAILGSIFGFIITRQPVLGVLQTDVETEALSSTSVLLRTVATGFVYGLIVWAILPVIVLPVWAGATGTSAEAAEFPAIALESLIGHLVFGTILGIIFALTLTLYERQAEDPLAE